MSILHLIVRRQAMTPSPAPRTQRGCMVPSFLRDATADARGNFDHPQHRGISTRSLPGAANTFRKRPLP